MPEGLAVFLNLWTLQFKAGHQWLALAWRTLLALVIDPGWANHTRNSTVTIKTLAVLGLWLKRDCSARIEIVLGGLYGKAL